MEPAGLLRPAEFLGSWEEQTNINARGQTCSLGCEGSILARLQYQPDASVQNSLQRAVPGGRTPPVQTPPLGLPLSHWPEVPGCSSLVW